MKKALSFLVAVVMVLAIFPVTSLAADEYYLWVGGVKVDSSNKDDVLGDGTVSFDPESYTLLLSGTEIDTYYSDFDGYNEAIVYTGYDALTIELKGRNVISASDLEYAIDSEYADLTICGKGYLEVTAEDSCIYVERDNLTVKDCVLKLESDSYHCVYADDGIFAAEDCAIDIICLASRSSDYYAVYVAELVADNVKMKVKAPDADAIVANYLTMTDCVLDLDAYYYNLWASYDLCLENCRGSFKSECAGIYAYDGDIAIRNCIFKMDCYDAGIGSDKGKVTIEDSVLDIANESSYYAALYGYENVDITGSRISIESENGYGIGSDSDDLSITDSQIKATAMYNALYGDSITISGGEIVAITGDEDYYAVYVDDGDLILEDDAVLEMFSPYCATNAEPVLYKGAVADYGDRKDLARMNVRQMSLGEDWYENYYVRIHPEEDKDPVTITIPVNTAAEEEEENPDTGAPVLF